MYAEFLEGAYRVLEGLHIDLHPAVAGGRGGHWLVATLVTLSWLLRTTRQSGKAGRVGAGLVGWGRLGRRAGWNCWPGWGADLGVVGPGGLKGMDQGSSE